LLLNPLSFETRGSEKSAFAESTKDGVISKHRDGTTIETPRGRNHWNLRADKLRSTSATSDVTLSCHDPCGVIKTILSDAKTYNMGIITDSTYGYLRKILFIRSNEFENGKEYSCVS
jgi:hypothetical protein